MFFDKYFFLFLISLVRISLNFFNFLQNLSLGIFAKALYILAVVNNRNINCCFVLLFGVSGDFSLAFLFWEADGVEGVAVDVAVVVFRKI